MPEIKQSVGNMGVNSSDDVALVQLMLRVVKSAKGLPYYAADYNGTYDAALKTAITQFQQDQKLVPDPAASVAAGVKAAGQPGLAAKAPAAPPPGLQEKPGQLGVGSKTLAALIAKLPPEYKDVRMIPGGKTIYIPGDAAKATTAATELRGKTQLNADFREKLARLVESVYKEHKVVLGIPADGWRRDFAGQANVNSAATGAGPGESPHQFGRAVDIGFASLKWVTGSGGIKTDNFWLEGQGLTPAKQSEFWAARNAIAFQKLGLYKTNKAGDVIHVQGFSDDSLSWGKSLAKLLETVSPAKAKWSVVGGSPNQYKADLGLGIPFTVGSSNAVWAGQAAINKTELVKALNAKLAVDPGFSVEKFLGIPAKDPPPPAGGGGAAKAPQPAVGTGVSGIAPIPPGAKAPLAKPPLLKEDDITAAAMTNIQKLLQKEIQAADANWDKWAPVK